MSKPKEIVLIGAGHAHVVALRSFGYRPIPDARITLITPGFFTPYSGMLPGLVAGHYRYDDAHIDVRPLARFSRARLVRDKAVGIDLSKRFVICNEQEPVRFDILSLDIGSAPNTASVPGAAEHAIPIKPIDNFLARFEALQTTAIERAGRLHIAVVGAGAGGVELLLAVEARLRADVLRAGFDPSGLSFTLLSGAADILPTFPGRFRQTFRAILASRGVKVVTNAQAVRVGPGRLFFDRREPIEADEILWATQGAPFPWLAETALPLDRDGFVRVDEHLRAVGHDNIFAAGDTIAFEPRSLPKAGVYAVRAAPVLAENIRRAASGKPLETFHPQKQALYLLSVGRKYAVGTRNGFTVSGRWVWWWKDWLDRRFMSGFRNLPVRDTRMISKHEE
jgi:selenide,water dikinase